MWKSEVESGRVRAECGKVRWNRGRMWKIEVESG